MNIYNNTSFYFNSIKVQLELKNSSKTIVVMLFQFHKGTIRTGRTECFPNVFKVFQFHKGTIRTTPDFIRFAAYINFNSIKVQLELILTLKICLLLIFQFHKGTIRTFVLLCTVSFNLYFNSIKVQLERYHK